MWDLPGPGLKPVFPALAGGFLTTAPPGKSDPFTFNLYVSLYLKWTYFRQYTVESCFLIRSDNLYLLTDAFRPLTFKVIIDVGGLIFVTVFYSLPLFFGSIFLFHSFSAFCDLN